MFDAKSLLEMLVRGAQPAAAPQAQTGGGLADILGQMMQQGQAGQSQPAQGGAGGRDDILGQLQKQLGGAGGSQAKAPAAGGGLGDILGQLQKQMGGAGSPSGQGSAQGGGGLMDILGQVLGQATSGVKEGAGRLDQMTGASDKAREALGQATGSTPEDLLGQLQELIKNNQLGAGAALGGLGGLVLGTKTGRSVAMGAAKLGALALIGGLAYKAYQNYSQGQPLMAGNNPRLLSEPAPNGSGFEPQAVSNESAQLYIRTMIAAAAADGRIDAGEQKKILGGLQQAGLDAEAKAFLQQELESPASVEDLAASVQTPAEAVQVFTAARMAIDLDTQEENDFLVALADKLGIDANLAAHIDATATAAAA